MMIGKNTVAKSRFTAAAQTRVISKMRAITLDLHGCEI